MSGELQIPSIERFSGFHGGTELEFRYVGAETLCAMIDLAGLRPDHHVIEVGSGIGRIALPLTNWLGRSGQYLGVEIVQDGVAWCKQNICARFPNFQFVHLDIYNEFYNPAGKLDAASAWREQALGPFDFAIFVSVFTHLSLVDAKFYVQLMHKLLETGGTIYSTWFLIDRLAQDGIAHGNAAIRFGHKELGLHYLSAEKSTAAVGFDEAVALELFAAAGFHVVELVHGAWCGGRSTARLFQDVIVARKPA